MRTKIVSFATLSAHGRWKVEFFCNESSASKSVKYPLVQLHDVLHERREALNPQSYPDHVFNYLGLEHVQSVTGDLVDFQPRPGSQVLSRSKVFRDGDLLYGRLRPSLNKVFVADESLPEGICSGEFYVLIPDQKRIRPHFARALLASCYVQEVVGPMTTGSALPRLQIEDLLAIEIPLPPLKEQSQVEELLLEQQLRRLVIARELSIRPSDTLNALVAMLEDGVPFHVEDNPDPRVTCFSQHKLPSDLEATGKGRGRPRKQNQTSSLFERA